MHVARSSIVETLAAVCEAVLVDANNLSQAEIGDIEDLALRLLKGAGRARNATITINLLPVEVLGHIFSFLCPSVNFAIRSRPPARSLDLSSVLSVCHHWREVALTCPPLWSTINLRDIRPRVEEYLRRSGSTPLKIAKDHMDRIQHLHLSTGISGFEQLTTPASSLQSLVLLGDRNAGLGGAELSLFDGQAPLLRGVIFKQFSVWHMCRFASLTRIGLVQIAIADLNGELLDMLQACSRLKHVCIHKPKLGDATPSFGTQGVSLPCISTFYLEGLPTDSAWVLPFLSQIELPAHCDFRLCRLGPNGGDIPPPSLLRTLPPPTVHRLRVCRTVRVLFGTTDDLADRVVLSKAAWYMTSNKATRAKSLGFTEQGLILEACTNFIAINPGNGTKMWRDLLAALPSLTRLEIVQDVSGKALTTASKVLRPAAPASSSAEIPTLCPGLQTLVWHTDCDSPSSDFWITVEHRARSGVPLRSIHVIQEREATVVKSVRRFEWGESGLVVSHLPNTKGIPSTCSVRQQHLADLQMLVTK
ncbi:hypothetical protein GGF50DRAFT_66492 [Schizophyllum commune]